MSHYTKRKSISKKRSPSKTKRTSRSKRRSPRQKMRHVSGKVKAYCFPCQSKVVLDERTQLIKRKLPNGNTVRILCGYCKGCTTKNCTIITNSKK